MRKFRLKVFGRPTVVVGKSNHVEEQVLAVAWKQMEDRVDLEYEITELSKRPAALEGGTTGGTTSTS